MGWVDNDSYSRWNWVDFESSQGQYNWALIDTELTKAKARHGRFGMRLMPLCEGCAPHMYNGAHSSIPDDLAAASNALIGAPPGSPGENYVLPDWNSDAYLSRVEALVGAIGAHYHDDPTFAFFDMSAYGNWGEMHLYPFTSTGGPYETSTQKPITVANATRIVNANTKAFANKLLVTNAGNPALAAAIASTTPHVGIRVDCLGSDGLAGGNVIMNTPGATDQWRVAPFITEWCQVNLGNSGADLFVQGETQVRGYHISMLSSGNFQKPPTTTAETDAFRLANVEAGYRLRTDSVTVTFAPSQRTSLGVAWTWNDDGVAPTYLGWRVVVRLTGPMTVEATAATDLRKVMPDQPLIESSMLSVPSLAPGTYTVALRVEDVQSISPPMFLAMQGRDADGNYVLGTIDIP